MSAPLFPLGQTVATPPALAGLAKVGINPATLLHRHVTGDWGDIDPKDKGANEQSIKDGSRILSVYKLGSGVVIWILTEAVNEDTGTRDSTCVMTPGCY